MPVVNFLTSAASFFYAVSSMLSGAQNNAAMPQSFVSNFQNSPTPFLQVGGGGGRNNYVHSARSYNFSQLSNNLAVPPEPNAIDSGVNYEKFDRDAADPMKSTSSSITYVPITSLDQNVMGNLPIAGPIEINYHDGETIATLYTDEYGNVSRCEMLEVNKPSEQEEALAKIAAQNKIIEKTNFHTMLNIIRACQALDKDEERIPPATPFDAIVQRKANMWTVVSGILPGTKWCGLKDIANGWADLGPEKELDKCCRSHDLCPRKVLAFRAAYGLVNWSFYTKSHCECDAALYDCLKKASVTNPAAELMGNFYFNVLRAQCVDSENPPKCLARKENASSCLAWENDGRGDSQRFVFRQVKQLFR